MLMVFVENFKFTLLKNATQKGTLQVRKHGFLSEKVLRRASIQYACPSIDTDDSNLGRFALQQC
jgi:hypothetical protein